MASIGQWRWLFCANTKVNYPIYQLLNLLQISISRCVVCQAVWQSCFSTFLPPLALGATNSLRWTGCKRPWFSIVMKLISLLIFSGNFLVIAATCSITIALTFGGINFPWSSAHILAPLVIGLVGLVFFILYDAIWARYPLVRFAHASLVYLLQIDSYIC